MTATKSHGLAALPVPVRPVRWLEFCDIVPAFGKPRGKIAAFPAGQISPVRRTGIGRATAEGFRNTRPGTACTIGPKGHAIGL